LNLALRPEFLRVVFFLDIVLHNLYKYSTEIYLFLKISPKKFLQLFVDILQKEEYKNSHMTLAEKLQKLRKKQRMSMSQIARLSELSTDPRVRITQGYISRLESGKETNPSLQKLLTLCSIYNIEPNELFAGGVRKRGSKHPFTTKIARTTTQQTETGIRRVAETLARSPRHMTPVMDLLQYGSGRQILSLLSSTPEKLRERFLDQMLASVSHHAGCKNSSRESQDTELHYSE
jgi:transcriptional regulator with XRE-family HTH domain